MAYSTKRRFMAGAVCPRCAEMDKLVVYNDQGKDYRECVSCGFKEEMRLNIAAGELATRVHKTEEREDAAVQVITILPAGDNRD